MKTVYQVSQKFSTEKETEELLTKDLLGDGWTVEVIKHIFRNISQRSIN